MAEIPGYWKGKDKPNRMKGYDALSGKYTGSREGYGGRGTYRGDSAAWKKDNEGEGESSGAAPSAVRVQGSRRGVAGRTTTAGQRAVARRDAAEKSTEREEEK